MRVLVEIWRLLDARQKRALAAMQALSVVMAFSTVGGVAAILPFLTVLADPAAIGRTPLLRALYDRMGFESPRAFVVALGIGFVCLVLFANALMLVGSLFSNRLAFRIGDTLYRALFEEYLERGYAFHARTSSSSLASKVLHETGRLTTGILQSGLILITNLLTAVVIAAAILLLNPGLSALAIGGLAVSYIAIYTLARRKLLRNGRLESRIHAERSTIVAESFGAIREITLLHAQQFFVAKFARCCRSISRAVVTHLAIAQSPKYILECALTCALVLVALYSSAQATGSSAWIAQLSFVGFAAYRLLPALQQSFAALVRIRADSAAFENIAGDLRAGLQRARTRAAAHPTARLGRAWSGRPRTEIRLEAVSFSYAAQQAPALDQVSLCIEAGSCIGFTGANGSGKSTLLDIFAGLLVPDSGFVSIDGVRLDEANCRSWQAMISYVPQQVFLLDRSLAQNIAFGLQENEIDRERLRAVVELARLEDCVAGLAAGYDELLGERGARLSGGQRQRLGIARALYRNAPVIILDEATSALDADAELQLSRMLAGLRGSKTLLISAHRAAALQFCDDIVVLDRGRISGRTPGRKHAVSAL